MAETTQQPTVAPTNKLTAATAVASFMAALLWLLEALWPELPNEQLIAGLTPVAIIVVGWFIRDAPNV